MDEPLSNLDAKLRVNMRAELKHLQHELMITTIYVTHDQIEAMTLADRVAVMNEGVISQLDTPERIYNDPANLFVAGFIGSPSMNLIPAKFVKAPLSMENSPSRLHVETTNNACSGFALKIWKSPSPGMGFFQPRSTHLNSQENRH